MKALLIAEKGSLMRTIQGVYNKNKNQVPYDCDFLAQSGHLVTLKTPSEIEPEQKKWCWDNLPFHPEEHGGWQTKIITGTGPAALAQPRYKAIQDALKTNQYDFIIHAGDPDQEGQLLVDLVLNKVNNKLPVKRFWTNDTTDEAILHALLNLIDYKDMTQQNLLKAAYGRQHSDYRFGMNLSQASSLKMNTRAAVGRVKTPILAIVCRREDEIANFVPTTCYGVKALYSENFDGILFKPVDKTTKSEKTEEDDENSGIIYFDTEKEAKDFISILGNTAIVESYQTKRVETYAPKFFKLATAQVAASKLGYSSDQTLAIIQSLYEKGYVSYPRTDCEYISSKENLSALLNSTSSISEFQSYLSQISSNDINRVRQSKKWTNDKELENHGHTALIPTTRKPNYLSLSPDEQTIYTLICRQFIAAFLPPLVQDKTVLVADINGHKFKSNGKTVINPGYSVIFNTTFVDNIIPVHQKGDILQVNDYECTEKTTKCPSHLTDADIIEICEAPFKFLIDNKYKSLGEHLKIGTSATRASIIKQLIERDHYLEKKKIGRKFYLVPTDTGRYIYDNLKDCKICRVDLTGEWEEQLDLIRTGKLSLDAFEQSMMKDVEMLIDDIRSTNITAIAKTSDKILGKCPKCGSDIAVGKFGAYCVGKCGMNVSKAYGKDLTEKQITDLLNGKKILVKGLLSKKTGKHYDAYLIPTGISENNYNNKTYYGYTFDMSFPSK